MLTSGSVLLLKQFSFVSYFGEIIAFKLHLGLNLIIHSQKKFCSSVQIYFLSGGNDAGRLEKWKQLEGEMTFQY